MTQAQAASEASRLKTIAQKWGVTTSVELQAGRGVDPWAVYKKYHRMWHHTVSTYKVGGNLTPCLWLVKTGRTDVVGPLCNGYIGYDRVFRIICMGEANHPGLGGPITIDGVYIPKDSARKPTFGIEVEGGIQTWEDIDKLGPDMLQVMGRVDCALAEWSVRPLTSQMEHKTWAPTRKVDRKDFDGARVRGISLTKKWYNIVHPTFAGDWLDMATKEELAAMFKTYTSAWLVRPKMPDGTISPHVFVVAHDFSSKTWWGNWADLKVLDFIEDLNDAGKNADGSPKPHNLAWSVIGQIKEEWNPQLGTSMQPLPVDQRWKNTPPPWEKVEAPAPPS